MHKKKTAIILGFVIFCLAFQTLAIFPSNAQVTNLWGVSKGASRSYDYNKIYTGTISSTETYPRRTYRVVNIYDNNDNNYTELLLEIQTTSIYGLPSVSTQFLNDASASWTDVGLQIDVGTYTTKNPLYPVNFNGTDNMGFNWTAALVNYNTVILNWNMTIIGSTATLNRSYNGTDNGADYDTTIAIKWDIVKGWLISYDETKAYNETLGYTVHYQTIIYVSTDGFIIDWSIILSIIAITLGGIAIAFIYLTYNKIQKKK